jgi:hypothetical protein
MDECWCGYIRRVTAEHVPSPKVHGCSHRSSEAYASEYLDDEEAERRSVGVRR